MNKIINGRRYDTDRAKCIAGWDNGELPGDLGYYEETLYRKRTGEHFLCREGGAMSPVSRTRDGSITGGWDILPLSLADAKTWGESKLSGDDYAAAFGDDGVDESVVYASVSAEAKLKLADEALRTGSTQAEVIERLLMGLGEK